MVRQVRHIRFSFKYVFFSVTHIQVNQIYQISKKSLNIDRFYIQVHLKIAVFYRKLYILILLKVRINSIILLLLNTMWFLFQNLYILETAEWDSHISILDDFEIVSWWNLDYMTYFLFCLLLQIKIITDS